MIEKEEGATNQRLAVIELRKNRSKGARAMLAMVPVCDQVSTASDAKKPYKLIDAEEVPADRAADLIAALIAEDRSPQRRRARLKCPPRGCCALSSLIEMQPPLT